jgi:hypothetical protein
MPRHDDYHFMPLDGIIVRPLTSFDGMETAALKCLNECRLLVPAVDDEHCASLHWFSPRFPQPFNWQRLCQTAALNADRAYEREGTEEPASGGEFRHRLRPRR